MLDAGKRKGTLSDVSQAAVSGAGPNWLNLSLDWEPKIPELLLDRTILVESGSWSISGADVAEPRPKRIRKAVDRLEL
jgi:hypothetical protein